MKTRLEDEKPTSYLKEIKETFDYYKIPVWLEDGTLLGAVRDGGAIPWDKNDIDLGAFKESFSNKQIKNNVTRHLAKKGFSIYFFQDTISIYKDNFNIDVILPTIDKKEAVIKRVRSHNAFTDFFIRTRKLSELTCYGGIKLKASAGTRELIKGNFFNLIRLIPHKLRKGFYLLTKLALHSFIKADSYYIKVPKKHFLKLKPINYCGLEFNIPFLAENYLKKKYGDWQTPPKNPEKWFWWEQGSWVKNNSKNL